LEGLGGVFDPEDAALRTACARKWAAIKGMSEESALPLMENRLNLAAAMLHAGLADAMVAGAASATAEVLRPALELRRLYPGIAPVVSCFFMEVPDKFYGDSGRLVFADCGMNPEPAPPMLAAVAGAAARAAKELLELEPRVALLSFSTKGSAESPAVLKVRQALELAQKNSRASS